MHSEQEELISLEMGIEASFISVAEVDYGLKSKTCIAGGYGTKSDVLSLSRDWLTG